MAAHGAPQPDEALAELARRRIAECDRKLSQHRAAPEAGADPPTIAAWMQEELARKTEAERQLQRMPAASASPGREELVAVLRSLGDMAAVLGRANPERKARIYAGLGIRLAFHPDQRGHGRVRVGAADPKSRIGERFVSEGESTPHPHAIRYQYKPTCVFSVGFHVLIGLSLFE
jgi:site-specific DNA recombinase